jgi:hypothetical protein
MTSLSTRSVSLSDHVKRRRNSALSNGGSNDGCGASGSGSSSSSTNNYSASGATSTNNIGCASINSPLKVYSPQHHQNNDYHRHHRQPAPSDPKVSSSSRSSEGGYDSHVAAYGNYDAPSAHCRSYHASEHGCYAAESHIIGGRGVVGSRSTEWRSHHKAAPNAPTIHLARLGSYSNPLLDLEDQRYICSSSRQRRATKIHDISATSSNSSSGMMPQGRCSGTTGMEAWGRGGSMSGYSQDPRCQGDSSSCCSNAPTASTASSRGSSSNSSTYSSHPSIDTSSIVDEDAIRQGIVDFSTLVATYLAGALSFIIGTFLTLLSPLVKIIKCIVGDVRGLLGDAGFLHELGSLWRLYRDLRRSAEQSNYSSSNGDYQYYNHHHHHPRYQDDTSVEDGSTTVYSAETSAQFVGGWRPQVCPIVGSGCASSVNTPNTMGDTTRSTSSSWAGVAANASPRPYSTVPFDRQGRRPGAEVVRTSKNTHCHPNEMMWNPHTARNSESSPYYNRRSNNEAFARRPTDLSHQPQLPPRAQYYGPPYPQEPTNRYPRSKSDVVS